jgi:hypothetical protein
MGYTPVTVVTLNLLSLMPAGRGAYWDVRVQGSKLTFQGRRGQTLSIIFVVG